MMQHNAKQRSIAKCSASKVSFHLVDSSQLTPHLGKNLNKNGFRDVLVWSGMAAGAVHVRQVPLVGSAHDHAGHEGQNP